MTVYGSMHVDGRIHIVCQVILTSTIQEEEQLLGAALVMLVVVVLVVVEAVEVVAVVGAVVAVGAAEGVAGAVDVEARYMTKT